MQLARFTEVLNGTVNYFILGDLMLLATYRIVHGLPEDLATELTTKETGDEVVKDGIMVPLAGIENYPYTIIFHDDESSVELLHEQSDLQVRQGGYILQVENEEVFLFTWHILNEFSNSNVAALMATSRDTARPVLTLENGWYTLEIYGGLTMQETVIRNNAGEEISDTGLEPMLELVLKRSEERPLFSADISYPFAIRSDAY